MASRQSLRTPWAHDETGSDEARRAASIRPRVPPRSIRSNAYVADAPLQRSSRRASPTRRPSSTAPGPTSRCHSRATAWPKQGKTAQENSSAVERRLRCSRVRSAALADSTTIRGPPPLHRTATAQQRAIDGSGCGANGWAAGVQAPWSASSQTSASRSSAPSWASAESPAGACPSVSSFDRVCHR